MDLFIPDSNPTLEVVVFITFLCISQPVYMNRLFKVFFFDEVVVYETAKAANSVFCPGLLNVLLASTPPTIDWYLNLPTTSNKKDWGVYTLVLEKKGRAPLVYISSGTGVANGGVLFRWANYDKVSHSTSRRLLPIRSYTHDVLLVLE
jgi:hypothetical protein